MSQGSYGPNELAVMWEVLRDWCKMHERSPDSPDGVSAALKILDLMRERSLTRQELLRALEERGAFPN